MSCRYISNVGRRNQTVNSVAVDQYEGCQCAEDCDRFGRSGLARHTHRLGD